MDETFGKSFIKNMKQKTGQGTDLVSVYCPKGRERATYERLVKEQTTASRIKNKTVRKNVLAALKNLIGFFREFESERNGVVAFADAYNIYNIEPDLPVIEKIYKCGRKFHTAPLERTMNWNKEDATFGLVLATSDTAVIARLTGYRLDILKKMSEPIPRKGKKGGMSQKSIREYTMRLYKDSIKKWLRGRWLC